MSPTTGVAVVVVSYGSADLLAANLAPLGRACPELDVVVVDNFSDAAERARVTTLAADEGWTLVAPSDNTGFGGGMNLGVAEAIGRGADTFLLLNPDASIDGGAVAALVDHRRRVPMSLISPTVLRPDGSAWFRGAVVELDRGRTRSGVPAPGSADLPWLSGACLMTSRELWEVLGGFDEDYFLYWEDVDLSVRAARAGAELAVLSEVTAVHDEGGTQDRPEDRGEHSDTYYYFNIRNRLLFAAKNLGPQDRRRWLRTSIGESYQILLRGGGRRKFLRPWHPLRIGARGLWDGWRTSRAATR